MRLEVAPQEKGLNLVIVLAMDINKNHFVCIENHKIFTRVSVSPAIYKIAHLVSYKTY